MKKGLALVLIVTLLVGICSGAFAAVTPYKSKLHDVLERGYLIVGTGSTNVPWHSVNEKGEYDGFDIEMARILGDL
jgi:polar amino acid transport system substrate-binding protein